MYLFFSLDGAELEIMDNTNKLHFLLLMKPLSNLKKSSNKNLAIIGKIDSALTKSQKNIN